MNTPEKDDLSLPRQSEAATVPVRLDRCPSSVYYADGWNKCMDYIAHALKLARRMPESPDRDELDYTILQIAPSLTTPQPAQADTTPAAQGEEERRASFVEGYAQAACEHMHSSTPVSVIERAAQRAADRAGYGPITAEATPAAHGVGGSLLRKVGEPLPAGCYCKPGRCMAPVTMGRQQPCRDPTKAASAPGGGNG